MYDMVLNQLPKQFNLWLMNLLIIIILPGLINWILENYGTMAEVSKLFSVWPRERTVKCSPKPRRMESASAPL